MAIASRHLGLAAWLLINLAPSPGLAQTPPKAGTVEPSVAPAPEPSAQPAAAPPGTDTPPAPAAPPVGCFPACREGYICHVDRCISACNPPCRRDERCISAGECTQVAPPPPPPPSRATVLPVPDSTAEAAEPYTGAHRHDGFFLRLAVGAGIGGLHSDGDDDWGGGGHFSFDIGASPIDNFVLHFRTAQHAFALNEASRPWDFATVSAWGIGGTWYFMPQNIYLTGSLGFAALNLLDVDGRDVSDGDGGFGCGLDVGKEWWVSDNWGLGIAGRLHYVSVEPCSSTGLGVLFSASYQ